MRIWTHSQNLNRDFYNPGSPKGPMWRHGRAWMHLDEKCIGLEWHLLKRDTFAASITVGGQEEHQLQFHLSLPGLASLFLSFERFMPYRWFHDWKYWGVYGRQTGLKIFDNAIWLSIFHNDDECHGSPRWLPKGVSIWHEKHGFMLVLHPLDILFGYQKYASEELQKSPAIVHLPEGDYLVTVTLTRDTWKRPRWPKATTVYRANVESESGIPAHAGKGENSWDLDDDAVFSSTFPCTTVEEAVEHVAARILKDRKKYGNPAAAEKEAPAQI